jgi:hypothetical protein
MTSPLRFWADALTATSVARTAMRKRFIGFKRGLGCKDSDYRPKWAGVFVKQPKTFRHIFMFLALDSVVFE